MVEVELLQLFLSADFLVSLAVRTVVSGILLFVLSRFVGAKGGLLPSMGVALFTTIIVMFIFEAYLFPLLEFETTDILTALNTNVLGLVLSYVMPAAVWFFLVMMLLRVSPIKALMVAFLQWLLSLALVHFGILVFLTEFI